jgi:hypothetical protein
VSLFPVHGLTVLVDGAAVPVDGLTIDVPAIVATVPTSTSGDGWIARAFAADAYGVFPTTAGGWAVAGVYTDAYRLDGATLLYSFSIPGVVTGAPNGVTIRLPAGCVAAVTQVFPCLVSSNGVQSAGYCYVRAGSPLLTINATPSGGAPWPAGPNIVYGTIPIAVGCLAACGGLVLSGQSNALYLGPALTTAAAPRGVSTTAEGSQPIATWAPSGHLWAPLLQQLTTCTPAAFVWWQGESDGQLAVPGYAAALADLLTRVRAATTPTLRIVVVRIVDEPELAGVRADLAAWVAADAHAALVSVDDLPRDVPHGYHVTAASYPTVAARILAVT